MSPLLAPALALGLLVQQQLSPGTPPAPEQQAAAPALPPPPAWPPPPPDPDEAPYPPAATIIGGLPPTGVFEKGLGLNLLQLGPLEVISSGDAAYGVALGLGVEIDLGPRTALRIPLEINYAGSSNTDGSGVEQSTVFAYVGLSPGIVYRFRSERDQRWTAYLGGALKLGGFMFGRQLLGVAPNPPPATMQEFTRAGAAPDLMAGFLFTPFRWLTWRIALDYTYIFVAHTSVHALSETIGPQLSF